jgi:hypothetical protein
MTALAAAALVGSVTRAPSAEADSLDTTTTSIEVEQNESTTTTTLDEDAAALIACTDGAAELIAAEADGSIDPLQAAALDALREICDEQGFIVAGPPEPEPIISVVNVTSSSRSATSSDQSSTYTDDHDDDGEYEGEYHGDDDEHEDEHEDESHEHEDDH